MKTLGGGYKRQLAPHLSSKAASIPFFSTMTGKTVMDGALDAAYWRSNLESPVLFDTSVANLLKFQGQNSVLVEIGPHAALSGPLRQILGHLGSQQTSYVSILMRHEDKSKALLNTIGQLFCKGLEFGLTPLIPPAAFFPICLTIPGTTARNTGTRAAFHGTTEDALSHTIPLSVAGLSRSAE